MASFGKKILSAFLEVDGEKTDASQTNVNVEPKSSYVVPVSGSGSGGGAAIAGGAGSGGAGSGGMGSGGMGSGSSGSAPTAGDQRFSEYFDNLFKEANIPGPDYYEFARMTSAMQAIPDERSRFAAAFAGLQVQGLDRQKLLSTAGEYLRVLAGDADRFGSTVETALQEKVHSRTAEAEEKNKRIQVLSQEIVELQNQIATMRSEVREAKDKLEAGSNAYTDESERRKQQILGDIEKINNYIH